jgi:glycosyltransferase involved in cell wall biosynthesis
MPTLTLMLGNYNDALHIERAVGELLAQTVPPLEVLVVDDGSTDDSLARLAALAPDQPRLRVLRNERNQGVCFTYNRGITEARGEFIFTTAMDDHLEPTMVEQVTAILDKHPQAKLCCWDGAGLEDGSGAVVPQPRGWTAEPRFFEPAQLAPLLSRRGQLHGAVAAISRAEFLALGGMRPELQWYGDWFAVTVTALRHGLCYVPQCLSAFRTRRDSYSQRGHRNWAAQQVTVGGLMGLLESDDFADVRPHFQRSNLLRVIGWRGLCLLAGRRAWQRYINRSLLKAVMVDAVLHRKAALFPHLPRWTVALWRRLCRLWRRPERLAR